MLIYGFRYAGGVCAQTVKRPPLGRLAWGNGGTGRVRPGGEGQHVDKKDERAKEGDRFGDLHRRSDGSKDKVSR